MPTSDAPERMTYSIAETAALIGISETHVRGLIKTGEIPARRFGRRVLIPRSAIDRLFKLPEHLNGAGEAK